MLNWYSLVVDLAVGQSRRNSIPTFVMAPVMYHRFDSDGSISSTIMSVIRDAGSFDPRQREEGLRRFLEQYSAPLCAHLLRRRYCPPDEVQDVVHDFFVEKFLQPAPTDSLVQKFLERQAAVPTMRFRAYMLVSLNNFALDRQRRVSLPTVDLETALVDLARESSATNDAFEIDWAHNLLNRAIQLVREECQAEGQADIWTIFERQIIVPARLGTPAPGYEALMRELALDSPKQASNRLQTAVRKFRRVIRELIVSYLPPTPAAEREAQIHEEITDLLEAFRRPSAEPTAPTALTSDVDSSTSWHEGSLASVSAQLLELSDDVAQLWQESRDYASLWAHWLRSPLDQTLIDRPVPLWSSATGETIGVSPLSTLADALFHPQTTVELLKAVKDEAKRELRQRSADSKPLPNVFYLLLYSAAISAAWCNFRERITRDDDAQVAQRLRMCVAYPWLDDRTRALLQRWLSEMDQGPTPRREVTRP